MSDGSAASSPEPTARELRAARRRAHEEEKKRRGTSSGGKGDKMNKGGNSGPASADDRSRR